MATVVRTCVIALALVGATSTTYTPTSLFAAVTQPKPTRLPVPMCPPSDPDACHIVIKW